MRKMKLGKIIFFIGILICFSASLRAQDIAFSQFYANPLYLNPAFAGTAKCPRFVIHYRNEWPALVHTFESYSVSYDQHVAPISGGLGLLITKDDAGDGSLKTLNASGMYSYQLNINRRFSLKAGLQATYFRKSNCGGNDSGSFKSFHFYDFG